MQVDFSGNGVVSILDAAKLQEKVKAAKPTIITKRGRPRQSAGEAFFKSTARSIGRQAGRQIVRGLLGSLFGGRR